VEAHSDIDLAALYGFKSPGHLPTRFSFGFHGDLLHGGIVVVSDNDADDDAADFFCFVFCCVVLLLLLRPS